MKKVAFLLLILFSLVQIAPAIKSACDTSVVSLFNPDEEKSNDKTTNVSIEEIKEKKNHLFYFDMAIIPDAGSNYFSIMDFSEPLPMPIVDLLTPPPNQV
jgi:hypothetical protein